MSTTSAYDLTRQARWEVEGTRRAAERYREVAATADPSTLPSGRRLLREVVPLLTEAVKAAQAEAMDAIGAGPKAGRLSGWQWPMQLLAPEKLAVITLTNALRAEQQQGGMTSDLTSLAVAIAGAIRDELEFERWMREQVSANKAAWEARDGDHRNVLGAFKARYPNVDRKVWARWRQRVKATRDTQWDKASAVQTGAKLVALLVEVAPARFYSAMRRLVGGRTQLYLKIDEETLAMMNDIEERAAVRRPALMPMLCPPLPWVYSE